MWQSVYTTPAGINAWNGDRTVGFHRLWTEKDYKLNENLTGVQL